MTTEKNECKTVSEVIQTCMPQLEPSAELTTRNESAVPQKPQAQVTTIPRYGDFDNFRALFSPANQLNYCTPANWERCCCGKAPTLGDIARIYGNGAPKKWIVEQLYDMIEYCGCKDKFTDNQYYTLAGMIYDTFFFLKVTEIMLFMYLFKMGKYGHFYGYTDPMTIFQALDCFNKNERREIIDQKEDREKAERISKEVPITRAQWEEIKRQSST